MTLTPELALAFRSTPSNRHLGLELVERSGDGAVVTMRPRAEHLQEAGVVQGGFLSALADTTAVYALYPDLAAGERMTSIEFKLNFLRPATVEGGLLTARSRVVRRGRSVGLCDVEVAQSGEPVARGLFTYLFFR